MMHLKRKIAALALILFALNTNAQQATATIDKDPRIDDLLKVYHEVNAKEAYYQIQVGFRSKDSEARKLLNEVEIDYPNWFSAIEFKEPTYRVKLGKFKTRLEAERNFNKVREKYPNAMLLAPNR